MGVALKRKQNKTNKKNTARKEKANISDEQDSKLLSRNSFVVQQIKDLALSLQWLRWLLWHAVDVAKQSKILNKILTKQTQQYIRRIIQESVLTRGNTSCS